MSITRINDFRAAPGKEEALRGFLAEVISLIETAPGCLSAELLLDQEEPARLVVLEKWTDVAAHKAAASRIPREKMAEFMTFVSEPPKGRYYGEA